MLSLESALRQLVEVVQQTPVELASPNGALGRYAAGNVRAKRSQPCADLSAMDGFAIAGTGPWTVVGESRCGAPFGSQIGLGQAAHISTGAVIPDGASAVLIKENAQLSDHTLQAIEHPENGAHIRQKGFDFATGEPVIAAGQRIGPAQLALLIASGCDAINVGRPPRISILECGDELDAKAAKPGQLPPSNGAMLAAMCASQACETTVSAPLPDDLGAIAEAIETAGSADLIVISGGASVGDHDLVRPALKSIGVEPDFWRVAIKPGKPLLVARRQNQLILGLPGNPVSSFVTGIMFMLPAIRAMLGARDPWPARMYLPAAHDLPPVGPRREFLRATIAPDGAIPLDQQDSSALLALSKASCLIERQERCRGLKAGTPVPVYLLGNGGNA